tara:strand:- start:2225 stop:2611 length:387 start_codon:yes stop_codon:yes gene_type:complete
MDKDSKKKVFSLFISVYFELLEIIKSKFDKHKDFDIFYRKNILLKKTNIKLFIKNWYTYITTHYHTKINEGDIPYFLENAMQMMTSEYLKKYFIYFKQVYDTLDDILIQKVVQKVQQLTQMSYLYYNN